MGGKKRCCRVFGNPTNFTWEHVQRTSLGNIFKKKPYLRTCPMSFTWEHVQWTFLHRILSRINLGNTSNQQTSPEMAVSELYWGCTDWTLLDTAASELYLRLLSENFPRDCTEWTLCDTAANELYLRLCWLNFTWHCCQWTLLETTVRELYLRPPSENFTWDRTEWTLLETVLNEL